MAIVSVTEVIDTGSTISDDITRTYHRTFRVRTSLVTDGALAAREAPGIPKLYSSYIFGRERDLICVCVHKSAERDQGFPYLWLVRCEYSNKQNVPQQQDTSDNPLFRVPEQSFGFSEYSRPFVRDLTGRAVVNSATETFDPAPETEDSRGGLVVVRNERTFDEAAATLYQDAVNTDTFRGHPPYGAKFKSITGDQAFENNILYWKIRYEIQYRREGFLRPLLDQGFRDVNQKLFRDIKDGLALTNPTLLDGSGFPLYIHQRYREGANKGKSPYQIVAPSVGPAAEQAAFRTTIKTFLLDLYPTPGTQPTIDGYPVGLGDDLDMTKWPGRGFTYQFKLQSSVSEVEIVTAVKWSVTQIDNNASPVQWRVTVVRGEGGTKSATHRYPVTVRMDPVYLNFREFKELPFKVWRL